MPELRRDPVVGYWTIISTERSRRPADARPKAPADQRECMFCEKRESQTTGEVYAVRPNGGPADGPGWQVRVVLSKQPLLGPGELHGWGEGLYDVMDAVGRHELVIESPRHAEELDHLSVAEISTVVGAYISRFRDIEKDDRFKYALLFKNHGHISGSAADVVRHTRSQIIALPIVPKRVKEELVHTKRYFEQHERCIFCDILRQESRDRSRFVSENASFFAFCPFASRSPFEIWILPKKHSADFHRLDPKSHPDLASILKDCLARVRALLDDPPYNVIVHTAPFRNSEAAVHWRTIDQDYHWYVQIAPRLTRAAGFEWGSGIHINPTPPEEAALLLREAFPEGTTP